jgi:ubiquinone/menaquinone biosynthesis C-methylase UbiE
MRLLFWRRSAPTAELPAQPPRRWAWLGGRPFLPNSPYILPKDAEEAGRLDIQHYLFTLAAGGLYRAPLRQPRSILDVACGTGTWGREMAQRFPHARVIGLDIDESLPARAMDILGPGGQFPRNFRFQVADVLYRLPLNDASFDCVHARLISPFVPITRWPDVVAEMVRVLRPGGLIELVDHQTSPHTPSPAYNRFLEAVEALCKRRGVYAGVGDAFIPLLQQAGVQQIQQRQFVLGQGKTESDTRRQQRLLSADAAAFVEHMQPVLTNPQLGYFSDAEYEDIIRQVKQELPELGIRWPVVFCFGMKL